MYWKDENKEKDAGIAHFLKKIGGKKMSFERPIIAESFGHKLIQKMGSSRSSKDSV